MHEERERRKEIQRELETSRQQMQKMEERFQQLIKKKEEPEPEVPKFDDNPAINLNTRLTEAEKRLKEAAERDIQYQKMAEVQQHQARFAQDFSGIEEAYAKTKPDYYEAVQFLGQSRIEEYMTLGMSQQQALQAAHNDAMAIAVNSAQTGQNGPDVFYKLAVKRGWKGAAPKAPQKAAQDLEALARNVQESTSLGTSGGKDGDLTLASLADMDDDAFMKATSGDRWRKLWGA